MFMYLFNMTKCLTRSTLESIVKTSLKPIGPHAGVIYSRLYTQQHTVGFTQNNWAPHLPRPVLIIVIYSNKF